MENIKGTTLQLVEVFDRMIDRRNVNYALLNKDPKFKSYQDGEKFVDQSTYVVNCFGCVEEDYFNNEFIYDNTDVKVGDIVYAVIAEDEEPGSSYHEMSTVLGVFTTKPDFDTFLDTFFQHYKNVMLSKFNITEEDFNDMCSFCELELTHIAKIVELEVLETIDIKQTLNLDE